MVLDFWVLTAGIGLIRAAMEATERTSNTFPYRKKKMMWHRKSSFHVLVDERLKL